MSAIMNPPPGAPGSASDPRSQPGATQNPPLGPESDTSGVLDEHMNPHPSDALASRSALLAPGGPAGAALPIENPPPEIGVVGAVPARAGGPVTELTNPPVEPVEAPPALTAKPGGRKRRSTSKK